MQDLAQQFTRAEIDALRAIAIHGTIPAAAQALYLSPHTLYSHLTRLRIKTGLHHLPQLVALAACCGLVNAAEITSAD